MPLRHDGTHTAQIAVGQHPLDLAHPSALGHHVTGPPAQHGVGQLARSPSSHGAERSAQDVCSPLALGAPGGVRGAGQEAGRLAVDDHEGRLFGNRHQTCLERGEIDVQRVSGGRGGDGERVEQPDVRAAPRSASWQARARARGSGSWPRASSNATENAALDDRPAPTGSVLVTRAAPPLGEVGAEQPGRQGGFGRNRGGVAQGDLERPPGELVRVDPEEKAAGVRRVVDLRGQVDSHRQ